MDSSLPRSSQATFFSAVVASEEEMSTIARSVISIFARHLSDMNSVTLPLKWFKVFVGAKRKVYNLHKSLLCQKCPFSEVSSGHVSRGKHSGSQP